MCSPNLISLNKVQVYMVLMLLVIIYIEPVDKVPINKEDRSFLTAFVSLVEKLSMCLEMRIFL